MVLARMIALMPSISAVRFFTLSSYSSFLVLDRSLRLVASISAFSARATRILYLFLNMSDCFFLLLALLIFLSRVARAKRAFFVFLFACLIPLCSLSRIFLDLSHKHVDLHMVLL